MKHSAQELIELCYRYYPRGVSDDDPRYKNTEEYQRLATARRQAGASEEERWRPMLRRLRARFPAFIVQGLSMHLPTGDYDGGYSGQLYLHDPMPEGSADSLEFRVSFLAPYYFLFSSRLPEGGQRYEHHLDLLPDEEPYARAIVEEIEAAFPGYAPMQPEVGHVVVPDVVAGFRRMGEATLYHCLFADNLWI